MAITIMDYKGRVVKITDIKAVPAGFVRPIMDTLMVYLSCSEIGQPAFSFTVSLPFAWSLRLLREHGKHHLLADINGKAQDALRELEELDEPDWEKLRQAQKRQKELDTYVDEIKAEIGLSE